MRTMDKEVTDRKDAGRMKKRDLWISVEKK